MIVYTEDEINAAALAYFRVTFPKQRDAVDLSDRIVFAAYRSLRSLLGAGTGQILQANNDAIPRISKMPTAICAQNKAARRWEGMGVCLWSAIRTGGCMAQKVRRSARAG